MKKIYLISIIFALTLISVACSGENRNEDMSKETETHKNHDHQMKASEEIEHELVREGSIDVESLDTNNDESLYECPMDWNVLSDNSGDCPVCGMDLKEYSIAEVKANLDKYGYTYKK